ncbi:hypothetical protein [Paraburkholderia sp. BCC1885]|uniref:hypothetical protein n=1 Tax=Paraburkholderia sp. BCC1885 TaxID=2562669 RepID=UPI00118276F2|nr:hypothetical protein [Paraburkholderia sp. BCC1885]
MFAVHGEIQMHHSERLLMGNMYKRLRIVKLLVVIMLAVFQYGCVGESPSGSLLSRHGQSSSHFMEQDTQNLRVPQNIDEFFENIHYLVYANRLDDPNFYDSDQLLQKAFGAMEVHRISDYLIEDHERAFTISIRLGESPGQQCELHKSQGEHVQLYCNISGLVSIYYRDKPKDGRSAMRRMQFDLLSDGIYKDFCETFGGGWQNIDDFDRQRAEKVIVLDGSPPQPGLFPKPVPNGFGKDLYIGKSLYRLRAGKVINGNWSGIMITVKFPR